MRLSKLFSIFTLQLVAGAAMAAEVTGAVVDIENRQLIVSVAQTGCHPVEFDVKVGACSKSWPIQCKASLVPRQDPGQRDMYMEYTTRIDFDSTGLNNENFSRGRLTIHGDSKTFAILRLPTMLPLHE